MNEKKLKPHELQQGMYVSRLDRPWSETPFPLQGIRVQKKKDIDILNEYCDYVYIDLDKTDYKASPPQYSAQQSDPGDETISNLKLTHYPVSALVEEELPHARKHREELLFAVREMLHSVREGAGLNIKDIDIGIRHVEESILRNPSAFMLLRLLKEKDNYTYEHCVDVSALSIIVGRQLGLPRGILSRLALGGILFDIGKMRVPSDLLNKNGKLTDEEYGTIKSHVEEGLKIVSESEGIHKSVLDIIATHHERYDGSGYPNRLKKKSIPLLGRIVGIIDCYDAMTSNRSYSHALPNDEAIKQIYTWRNTLFQDEIVEYFIQAIGIYPAGTVVELSNGEVGIVIVQNEFRRLRPRIMIVLDDSKKPVFTNRIRDLYHETTDNENKSLDILKAVDPDKYNLNPREFFF